MSATSGCADASPTDPSTSAADKRWRRAILAMVHLLFLNLSGLPRRSVIKGASREGIMANLCRTGKQKADMRGEKL
jgi:hypothetical protein